MRIFTPVQPEPSLSSAWKICARLVPCSRYGSKTPIPTNKGRKMLGIAQSTPSLQKKFTCALVLGLPFAGPRPCFPGAQQCDPAFNSMCKYSTPKNPIFPGKESRTTLFLVLKKSKYLYGKDRAKNRRTSENTGRNRPHTPKVLNNSPTTIPAPIRKIRCLKTLYCANIQPENVQ
jgi:hypothetical protein